jgi:hypothetical protein
MREAEEVERLRPETGDLQQRGHPTGRQISFLNSFAIRGQYFNFSTAG